MTYVDDDYARFIDAFDPQPVEADPWAGWRAVAVVVAVFAVALAVVGLGRTALDDVGIAGASPASPSAFVSHCHSSPEALDWCEFLIWIETPGAREYHDWMTRPRASHIGWSVWDELRLCEAPDWAGGWQANTGNGYYGGLQFSLASWRSVGGSGYPHQHSRETQIVMGQRLQAVQGWGAWPTCSRKLWLR